MLSFSTAVDIAVGRGAQVIPYRWRDPSAAWYAAERGALLAGGRSAAGYSLSPASLLEIEPETALVLPSPNGGALSLSAGRGVYTACLRNAPSVARAVRKQGPSVAVIPAGEQWPDGQIRMAVEDLLGAGAVLAGLSGRMSPEAEVAVAAFERFQHCLPEALAGCISGRELAGRGFARDVALAAEYDVSRIAPVLQGDCFVAERTLPGATDPERPASL